MARLDRRLAQAEAALLTLEEIVGQGQHSLIERDGAVLRLIYTFEAVWKACQAALAERDRTEVGSPIMSIRAARRIGWLSDEDAEAAAKIASDRNLAVHMYRRDIGEEVAARLPAHAALLRRWLDALKQPATDR
jgi:hypothetical protein